MEVQSLRIRTKARAACSIHNEVWLALQNGGLAAYDAEAQKHLEDVPVDLDGCKNPQIARVAAVLNEVWAVTSDGRILTVDTRSHRVTSVLELPGSEKQAKLMDISFDGYLVALASEAGCVLALHPQTKKVLFSTSTPAPCTAVAQFSSTIAAGDLKGALYVWDALTQKQLSVHAEGKSEVLKLLYNPIHNRLWVARLNASIDLYGFEPSDGKLTFYKRLTSVGVVTGMVVVGRKVVVSTREKQLVVIDSANTRVLHTCTDAHKTFIHDVVKVRRTEIGQLWSLGNDGAICVCVLDGCAGPVYVPPLMNPPPLNTSSKLSVSPVKSGSISLTAPMGSEQGKLFDLMEDLRRAREEAQEMRLRSMRLEESLKVRDSEIAARCKELRRLEDCVSTLTKSLTDITSEKRSLERERAMLHSELNLAKGDLSRVSAEAASQMGVKFRAEGEVFQQKMDTVRVEQRLRDAESRLVSVQAENARLREAVGSPVIPKSLDSEPQLKSNGQQTSAFLELEKTLRLNYSLNSALTSMEYALRRKEEEEKDLNALLNAYRLKAADHVSDSYLSALLIATITRCPDRFELLCEDRMLSQFRTYSGPFIHFLDSLRNGDPEMYQSLVQYLHQHTIGLPISPQTQQRLDQLLALAFKEGDLVGAEALAAFKRGISRSGANGRNGSPVSGTSPVSTVPRSSANGTGSAPASFPSTGVRVAEAGSNFAATAMITPSSGKVVGNSPYPVRALTGEISIEEYRTVFEFILYTRRPLVEHLVLLHEWSKDLQQKVETFSSKISSMSTLLIRDSTPAPAFPHTDPENPLQAIVPVVKRIEELVSFLLRSYLTAAEKERLSAG